MTIVHTRMHWEDTARKDAISMLREAIKELEEHPERFLEYAIQVDPISAYPRLHRMTVVFEIPPRETADYIAPLEQSPA